MNMIKSIEEEFMEINERCNQEIRKRELRKEAASYRFKIDMTQVPNDNKQIQKRYEIDNL